MARLRVLLWGLLGVLALILALLLAAVTIGRPVLASLAADLLRGQGIAVDRLTLDEIGWREAVVSDVVLDGGRVTARRIVLAYDPADLLAGSPPDRVLVEGGTVRATIGSDGTVLLPFASADAAPQDTVVVPVLPAISLRDGSVILETPVGLMTLPMEAALAPEAGGLRLDAILRAQAAGGEAAIPIEGRIAADGSVDGMLRLSGEHFDLGALTIEGVRGRITAQGAIGTALRLDGAIAIRSVAGAAVSDAGLVPEGGGPSAAALHDLGGVDLAAIDLRDIGLVASGTPDRLDSLLLRMRYGETGGSLWIDLRDDGQVTRLVVDADLSQIEAVAGLVPAMLPVTGALRLQADAAAPARILDILAAPFDQAIDGAIRLSAADLAIGEDIAINRAALASDAVLSADRLVLSGGETWRLAGAFGTPALAVDLAWGTGAAPRITIDRLASGWRAETEGTVSGTIDGYGVAGRLTAALVVDAAGRTAVELGPAVLDLAPFTLGGLIFDPGRVAIAGSSTTEGWRALASGDLALVDPFAEGTARRATLSGGVEIRARGASVELVPIGCLALYAPAGSPAPGIELTRPATGSVCAVSGPLLDWDGERARLDLALRALSLATADGIEAEWGAVLVSGDVERAIDLTAVDGRVALPEDDVAVEDLAFAIGWSGQGGWLGAARAGAIDIPGIGPPVSADLLVRPDGEGRLALEGEASLAATGIAATVSGSVDPATGHGRVTVDIPETRLRPGGVQPATLVPDLGDLDVTGFDGRLGARTTLSWSPELALEVEARMRDAGFVTPFGVASGADGRFTITGPSPIRMPSGQELTIDRFDLGVPVEDVRLRFALDGAGQLSIGGLGFRWIGATVEVAPFRIAALAREPARITVTGLELPRLLAQWPVADLATTGTLDGTIPFRLDGDTIFIDHGRLVSRGPGVISYTGGLSAGATDENVTLVTSALANFRYETLELMLDGGTGGDAEVRLSIRGANPDVYDGYPIALNVNLTGALYDIIRTSLETARIDDAAREWLERGNDSLLGR